MTDLTPQTIAVMFKNIDEKLDTIHEQTLKTNGRVTKLESWRGFITGGLAILAVLVIPVLLLVISQYINNQ